MDLVYLELYLAGNADNILARLDLKGHSTLKARLKRPVTIILPVRNHAVTGLSPTGNLVAPATGSSDPPIFQPGIISVYTSLTGQLTLKDGMTVIAEYGVTAGNTGVTGFTTVSGVEPTIDPRTHSLLIYLSSQFVRTKPITVTLTQPPPLSTAHRHELSVVTRNVSDFEGWGVAVLNPWNSDEGAP